MICFRPDRLRLGNDFLGAKEKISGLIAGLFNYILITDKYYNLPKMMAVTLGGRRQSSLLKADDRKLRSDPFDKASNHGRLPCITYWRTLTAWKTMKLRSSISKR